MYAVCPHDGAHAPVRRVVRGARGAITQVTARCPQCGAEMAAAPEELHLRGLRQGARCRRLALAGGSLTKTAPVAVISICQVGDATTVVSQSSGSRRMMPPHRVRGTTARGSAPDASLRDAGAPEAEAAAGNEVPRSDESSVMCRRGRLTELSSTQSDALGSVPTTDEFSVRDHRYHIGCRKLQHDRVSLFRTPGLSGYPGCVGHSLTTAGRAPRPSGSRWPGWLPPRSARAPAVRGSRGERSGRGTAAT
jgi:hypothetical protein